MRKLLTLIAALACFAVVALSSSCGGRALSGAQQQAATNSAFTVSQEIPKESKIQPKEVTLCKECQDPKWGEVAFNHDTHSQKNYSIDGKAVIPCVECHHTDQPASALKAPLKKSERDAVLTAALLQTADAKPVKSCSSCHFPSSENDNPEMPKITYEGKDKPTKVTNEIAYHKNCNTCHDLAIAEKPVLKGKIPGNNDCGLCHKPLAAN